MSAIHDLTSYFRQLQTHTHRQEPMSCHGKNHSGLRALGPQVLEALKLVMLSALLDILKGQQPSDHQTGGQKQNRDAGIASGVGPTEGHKPSALPAPAPGAGQGPAPAPSAAHAPVPVPSPSSSHSPAHSPAPSPAPTHTSAAEHKPPTRIQTETHSSSTAATGAIKPPSTDGLEVVVVNKPIVIKPGENFDGSGKLYVAGPGLKGGGTAETADPVFIVGPGAKMSNVAYEGGDGIHLLHDAKLDNVHAIKGGPDDMITIDGPGNQDRDAMLAGIARDSIPRRPAEVSITNSTFQHSHDKAIQINGDANLKLDNIYASDVGQLAVTLGGAAIEAHVSLNNAELQDVRSHTFRFDSARSSLTLGDNIEMGGAQMSVMMGDTSKVHGGNATVRPTTDRAA
jgi:hypothetical protein